MNLKEFSLCIAGAWTAGGIAPTDDPVLMFRSPAYANSFVKRLTGR